MKVRIAVGLGATAPDAGRFPAVVGALGPPGFDSLWISEVLTGLDVARSRSITQAHRPVSPPRPRGTTTR